jgi:hypothetical protein
MERFNKRCLVVKYIPSSNSWIAYIEEMHVANKKFDDGAGFGDSSEAALNDLVSKLKDQDVVLNNGGSIIHFPKDLTR